MRPERRSGAAGASAAERVRAPVWRGLDVFRVASLCYATALYAAAADDMLRPGLGWAVLVGMTAWTVLMVALQDRRPPWLVADLVVAVLAVLATRLVQAPEQIADGAATLPTFWAAAPVVGWAVRWGWRGGVAAAAAVGVADLVVAGDAGLTTVHNIVLLLLAGLLLGYSVRLVTVGRARLDEAAAIQAATRERERLARDIHDSVLQVLAYVQRRGAEVGGEAAEIGRLAGEQEARLRSLIATGPPGVPERSGSSGPPGGGKGTAPGDGRTDLRRELAALATARVTVSGPAEPVLLARPAAEAVVAAVREAVTNVRRHVGETAPAWVLVEDEGDDVVVSVRDDGPGIAPGRLESAAASGRLGIRSSICGRIADVGGHVDIVSTPGQGTEVEMRVPRVMRP